MTITRHRHTFRVLAVGSSGVTRLPDHTVEFLIVRHDDGTTGLLAPYPLPRP